MSGTQVAANNIVVPPSLTLLKTVKVNDDGATFSKNAKKSRPPTGHMVNAAIRSLNDRKGSSLQAIKKYIANTYNLNVEKIATYIRKYLNSAVQKGDLVLTKGKGAAGSFKLSKKMIEEKTSSPKPAKAAKATKKSAVKTKNKANDAATIRTKASPKAKKGGKASTAKPKTPKPKKAAAMK